MRHLPGASGPGLNLPRNGVDSYCSSHHQVLQRYRQITPQLHFSGPTDFAPLIRAAIDIVRRERRYHILLIIADGQVLPREEQNTFEGGYPNPLPSLP